jgi:hypothetical protein
LTALRIELRCVWISRLLTYFHAEPKSAVVLESVTPPAGLRKPLSVGSPNTGNAYPDIPNGNHAFPPTRKITNNKCRANVTVVT